MLLLAPLAGPHRPGQGWRSVSWTPKHNPPKCHHLRPDAPKSTYTVPDTVIPFPQVRWEATLAALLAPPAGPGAPQTSGVTLHELGPGQQIKAMVKRLSLEAWRSVVNVQP